MVITLVSHVDAKPGANGGTTGEIDTTGANLLIVAVAAYLTQTATPTDSKGNSWTGLTGQLYFEGAFVRIFYSIPASVGSGHTVTFSASGSYPVIMFSAFSGAGAYDKEGGSVTVNALQTSLQPGSLTPTEDNSLLYTSICTGTNSRSRGIDSGFSVIDTEDGAVGINMGAANAYKIQTIAGAENPTWSWTNADGAATAMAVFKAAAVATKRAKIIGGGIL